MLRLRKNLNIRVPNKLAALSAVMLLITALTGSPGALSGIPSSGGSAETVLSQQSDSGLDSQTTLQNQQPKKFKVSLMLFPAN